MANIWTNEQLKVIETRNRNILVSAAAGSGKTAVLVERIVGMVTDKDNPIDVDKLLVVTFTNAAAAEMRERIMKALAVRLSLDKENEHLQRQMTYIHNAKITTIDSFCLNIVKEHFGEINLDPNFRIGNNDELELLKADVLKELLDRYFEEGSSSFLEFIDTYISRQGKSKVEEIILKLYTESMSRTNPKEWMLSLLDNYTELSEEKIKTSKWFKLLAEDAMNSLSNNLVGMYKAIELAKEEFGPLKYLELFEEEASFLKKLLECEDINSVMTMVNGFEFKRLPTITKNDAVDEGKKETAKQLRNEFKDNLNGLKKTIFGKDIISYMDIVASCYDGVKMLVKLTMEFMEEYTLAKREKNLIDFAEIEHFALEILIKCGQPTETAKEISEEFYEILIDEYQDSNYVQEEILKAVSKRHKGVNNIFMVGDVKQSIYGFRQAKPELFLQKFDTYNADDDKNMKICLSKNFRSRKEVLDTCNLIFGQLMVKDLGGINYNEEQALYLGADYRKSPGNETEVIIVNTEDEEKNEEESIFSNMQDADENQEELGKLEIEANVIADRITKLINSKYCITDKNTKELRQIRYSDIAIIVRSMRNLGDTINTVLNDRDIPVESITTTGYFDTFEIKNILNYLLVVDNPRQDIPLVSVLRNIYGFSEEELAIIRGNKKGMFYDTLCSYDGDFSNKVNRVLGDIERFRKQVCYSSIYDLINDILTTTGFRDFVLAMGNGKRRTANIEMLLEKSVQYESSSFSGLFNFVRYIERIRSVEIEQGEAGAFDNTANSVKLMTIHKSKGLEFPVVILAGAGKQMNEAEFNKDVIVNSDIGLGIDYLDKDKRIKYRSPIKRAAVIKGKYDNRAEELRVLYVALTRAKEKLIIVGSINLPNKINKLIKNIEWNEKSFTTYAILSCKSYMDMILLALIRHRSMRNVLLNYGINPRIGSQVYDVADNINVSVINTIDVMYEAVKRVYISDVYKKSIEHFDTTRIYDEAAREILRENLDFKYLYAKDTELVAKVSVSDVKHKNMVDTYEELEEIREGKLDFSGQEKKEEILTDEDMPEFLREDKSLDGAARGTVYHRVFELIDYSKSISSQADVREMFKEMINTGRIKEEDIALVDEEKIYRFLLSDIGKRMKKAYMQGKLYREKQFVMGEECNKVFEEKDSREMVLVQGIIDAMFEEEGELVIVDYKTDNVNSILDLEARYKKQLELYRDAATLSLGKKVKELVIYSTKFSKELTL